MTGHCRLNVLIVDDYVDAATTLSRLLAHYGHKVQACYSSAAALEIAKQLCPDVIFLDLAMPEVDGFDVALQLRDVPALQSVTLVALTGYAGIAVESRAAQIGFDHFVIKPIEAEKLQSLLVEISHTVVSRDNDRLYGSTET
jgi:CheY-like chemotaxis protein